jgi:phospholipase C
VKRAYLMVVGAIITAAIGCYGQSATDTTHELDPNSGDSGVLHVTHIFKPTFVNDFMFGFHSSQGTTIETIGDNSVSGSFLRPAKFVMNHFYAADARDPYLPGFTVSTGVPFSIGSEDLGPNPEPFSNPIYSLEDDASLILGKHTLKFGAYGEFDAKSEYPGIKTTPQPPDSGGHPVPEGEGFDPKPRIYKGGDPAKRESRVRGRVLRFRNGTLLVAALLCLSCAVASSAGFPSPGSPDQSAQFIAALRAHIHHVFVIYQENRSFDFYFGDYPGADNLTTAEARAHGFRQWDPIGHTWLTPFFLKTPDVASPKHSRGNLIAKSDRGRMDLFVAQEELYLMENGAPWQYAHQLGQLTMAYEDCHTVPFLWYYAHNFALYDHIFEGFYDGSTPGNIDLIAGQVGQTQRARNPRETSNPDERGPGEPIFNDLDPHWGPYSGGHAPKQVQLDQTYATVLLTLLGQRAAEARNDNDGVKQDIGELARLDYRAVPWGWYQQGFGDGKGNDHPFYVPHHNAPQYFGYIRLNPAVWSGVHDLSNFSTLISKRLLPPLSVDFIKGGHGNPYGWRPANPDPRIQAHFAGDDDHPADSDSQIAESFVAKFVNLIARSPYWHDSAIIILWDDPGGFYDHVPPPQFERCPDSHPCGDGPRIPLILISPYARSSAIVSASGDHASFAKFLDVLFDLPPLASLPDEKPYMPEGPRDTNPKLTNLLGGFDPARLAGSQPPIPPAEAEIPDSIVNRFPPPMPCDATAVKPVLVPDASASPPAGFNPLPQN